MEGIGIKLFGKKIACPESVRITSLPLFSTVTSTAVESSDDGHNQQNGCDHGLSLTRGEKKQEDESSLNLDGNPETPMADDADKALKKPDKILPCPRCNSMDTKFCYYNNYNVRQPRHFCKSCQRYWTAGGTMRNMQVGAGRRKIKIPTSQYQILTISQEALLAAQIEAANASNGVRSVPPKLLSFGSDSPDIDYRSKENGDSCSSGSTVTTSNSVVENHVGFSWSYNPWNSAIPIPVSPFHPSPYWNCVPWLPLSSPTQNQMVQTDSCILGKHSRDEESMNTNGSEEPKKQKSSVLIPKTLRIDDPDEASKSSIWLTLGIKNENIRTGGLFKAFETKAEERKKDPAITTTSPVLQANPAAFSRSLCFQERA